MNTLELNIGLLRNTDKLANEVEVVNTSITSDFGKHDFRVVEGMGDWGKEQTYIAKIKLEYATESLIRVFLEHTCKEFKQDCIAYMINGVGYMAFNPDYKGEQFEFNTDYFQKY